MTAWYSIINGTEAMSISRRSKDATNSRREAPASLRIAATMVAVSRSSLMQAYWISRAILQEGRAFGNLAWLRNTQIAVRKYLHATVRPTELRPFCSDFFAAQCLFDLDRRAGIAMVDETKPANDNQDAVIVDVATRDKLNKVVL
jgi:hypothetical protein